MDEPWELVSTGGDPRGSHIATFFFSKNSATRMFVHFVSLSIFEKNVVVVCSSSTNPNGGDVE